MDTMPARRDQLLSSFYAFLNGHNRLLFPLFAYNNQLRPAVLRPRREDLARRLALRPRLRDGTHRVQTNCFPRINANFRRFRVAAMSGSLMLGRPPRFFFTFLLQWKPSSTRTHNYDGWPTVFELSIAWETGAVTGILDSYASMLRAGGSKRHLVEQVNEHARKIDEMAQKTRRFI